MTDHPDTGSDFLSDIPKPKKGPLVIIIQVVVVLACIGIVAAFMLPAVRRAGPAAFRSQCKNNLKQIGLALHNYADAYGALPPAYTVDADGKPLHSWRTLILPFVDQAPLYNQIDLSKPWNDPANEVAFKTRIPVYACPESDGLTNCTNYLALVGTTACFHPTKPRRLAEIADGTSQTIMVIEVEPARAVPWMTPTDVDEVLAQVLSLAPKIKHAHSEGEHALLVDGSIRYLLTEKLARETRRALISINGGETVGEF